MPLRGEPDPRTLQPGDAFGEYLIDEPLGQGGMGIVFRAVREDGAVVALKVLKPGLVADENATRRFAREARAAAEVVHPHLIDVIEAGDVDGTGYPRHALRRRPLARRPHRRARPAAGRGHASGSRSRSGPRSTRSHAAGFVHRDVKPSNILLDDERGALLTDFGLVKRSDYSMLTSPGQMLGTLDYIAPELLRGAAPGPGTDLYALGCVVFECLAGHAAVRRPQRLRGRDGASRRPPAGPVLRPRRRARRRCRGTCWPRWPSGRRSGRPPRPPTRSS